MTVAAICRTNELDQPGAFFTEDIDGTPVLVARDAQGEIRAHVNLCRHRGARLVQDRQGVTKSFTCLFHGWTYDAQGHMGGAPLARMAQTNPMLAKLRTVNALVPLAVELRHGFVWVAVPAAAPLDVAAFLGAVDGELAGRGVETAVMQERIVEPLGLDEELLDVVRPRLATADELRPISDTTLVVLHPDAVSLYTVSHRRPEGDFGQARSVGFGIAIGEDETRAASCVRLTAAG